MSFYQAMFQYSIKIWDDISDSAIKPYLEKQNKMISFFWRKKLSRMTIVGARGGGGNDEAFTSPWTSHFILKRLFFIIV